MSSDREHVLAIMMQLDVMGPAQPRNIERLVVAVVVGVDYARPADLAGLLLQMARHERALHGKMGAVLGQIGPAPVGLTAVAFQNSWLLIRGRPRVRLACHLAL